MLYEYFLGGNREIAKYGVLGHTPKNAPKPRRKFGHAQGVLKWKSIHMAEFEIVLLDLENPGYGDVAI